MKEPSPLREAQLTGLPYVKLVIDCRHLKLQPGSGRITVEGPVSLEELEQARQLLRAIVGGK